MQNIIATLLAWGITNPAKGARKVTFPLTVCAITFAVPRFRAGEGGEHGRALEIRVL